MRAEGLVIERDPAGSQSSPHAGSECQQVVRADPRSQPDDGRLPSRRKVAKAVQCDIERSDAGGGLARRLGHGGQAHLGNVADEGEREVKEGSRNAPKRGVISGEERRGAFGYVWRELDRDEKADPGKARGLPRPLPLGPGRRRGVRRRRPRGPR